MTTNSSPVSRKSVQKLILGPSKPITSRNSTVGSIIIGDYIDPLNNQRTLVLERAPKPAPEKAASPKKKAEPANVMASV
ncbi:MAG: hypothetical protein ACRDQZ_09200 [Mycobacteriales bacterium]